MHHIMIDDMVWHEPTSSRDDVQLSVAAPDDQPGRKFLVDGEAGFYVQTVRLPPGFEAPAHRHSHAEIFMVLNGSCLFNGVAMGQHDAAVVEPDESYAFTAGSDGVQFLVTRLAPSTFTEDK